MKKIISATMAVAMCSSFALGNVKLDFQLNSASAANTEWQEAYADFLKNGGYENYINASGIPKFTTAYIDGDDIPELALSTGTAWEDSVFIATYKNGKITPIKATEVGGADTYDTSKGCYGASGKLRYAEKGGLLDPDFYGMQYAYRTIYNVNDNATTTVECILYRYDTDYVNEEPVFEYAINGNKVTESEYNEKLSSYENKITSVIDYHEMSEITDTNIKTQLGISDDTQDDEKETSNKCGDNAYWNFDESTGTLTISGTGSTYDYDKYGNQVEIPDWFAGAKNYNIEHIVVEEGITRIGNSLFYGICKDIKFPESLEEIGSYALESKYMKEITIPKTVKKMDKYAFGTENDMDSNGLTGLLRVVDGCTVYGYTGSGAEQYVNDTNNDEYVVGEMKFVALDADNTADEYGEWRDSCKKVLKDFYNSAEYDVNSMWDLYDINGDGIPELIISYANSQAAYCEIYAYNGSDFTMLSADFYGGEINKFSKYGEIYAINGKNQFATYDINQGIETVSFFTMHGNRLTADITFSNNVGAVGEGSAWFSVNNKNVSLEEYKKACEPYKNYMPNTDGTSAKSIGRKYNFDDYTSVLETYNNPVVSDKPSESDLKKKSEKYGNVSAWQYHDYDGNGTNEAFAIITEKSRIKYLLFIDADGNITEMSEPKNKGDFLDYVDGTEQYTFVDDRQGFFSADMTGGAASFTLLYSVRNNIPYELDISGNINGGFKKHENNTFSALIHDEGRVGSAHRYELIYNNTDKQFTIGNRLNDSVSENITSGKCGENASWSFDKSTGTLTISGTGDIYDYGDWAYGKQSPPWCSEKDYGSNIKKVIIKEGITGIGEMCFLGSAVSSVSLPESLKTIKTLAFHECANLKEIRIPENVTEISDRAFGQYGSSGLGIVDGFIVYGYTGSPAQKYVNDVNNIENAIGKIKFIALDTESDNNNTSSSAPVNNNSADTPKDSPKTGDNIYKIFAPLAVAISGMVFLKKRNRKK